MYKIVKNIIITLLFCVLLGFSLLHIYTQYSVLLLATSRNNAYTKDISDIESNNKTMRQKIDYATESAYSENRIKGELSFGNDNDYKIIVDENLKNLDLYPKSKDNNSRIIKEWFKLFTW